MHRPTCCAELFASLGIERPVIVGHSWGTLVALALALEHPDAVAGLAPISGYYYPSARIDAPIFALPAVPVLGDILRYTVSPGIGRIITPAVVRGSFSPLPTPERFKAEFPFALTVRPSQIRATAEEAALMTPAAAEFQHGYHSLQMPVVILAGADDAIVDMQDHSARLRRDIPRSQLWVEPRVGHMLHYAAPDLVADAIDSVAARSGRLFEVLAPAGMARSDAAAPRVLSPSPQPDRNDLHRQLHLVAQSVVRIGGARERKGRAI